MFISKVAPGDQVVVVPDWATKILARKGKIEDIVNFSKMRQWFTQDQLVALDRFSEDGLNIFWNGGAIMPTGRPADNAVYTRSLGYVWFFPEEAGNSDITNEADQFARNQISRLIDNKQYSSKLVSEYILDHLKDAPADTIDITQSYSVYSASDKLIVVALNQGVLAPVIFNRKEELRLGILRAVVAKLQEYYDLDQVHQTQWFERYFLELDCLK